MNNALFRVDMDSVAYACKLCVPDVRRRALREHQALAWLAAHDLDLAPRPLGLDESCRLAPYPAVVSTWLEGQPLDPPLPDDQADALLGTLQQMHACHPSPGVDGDLLPAFFHFFDRQPYLEELHDFQERYCAWFGRSVPGGGPLAQELVALTVACEERFLATPVRLEADRLPLCLCHVDPTPSNVIAGPDGRLRWVDWEYSGWGDPALDLADFLWHERYTALTPEQRRRWRSAYQPPDPVVDPGFHDRLALWESLLAVRWVYLLVRAMWSAENGPDRLRLAQAGPRPDPNQQRERLEAMLERARRFYDSGEAG